MKVLTLVEESQDQTDVLARLLEERALLARVDHPNVSNVFDHGISDNHVFIAMEFFPCGDLKAAMERGFSAAASLAHIRQIAEGLSMVHAQGVIHREIKPANIMLRSDAAVALVDFGIAKEFDAVTTLTQFSETIGTPQYMNSEQINSTKLNARSDLCSLGAMFYEMFTGRKLFVGDRMESILMQRLHAASPLLPRNQSVLQPFFDMLLSIDPAGHDTDTAAFLKAFSVVELMRFSGHVDAGDKTFSGMADLDTLPNCAANPDTAE